MRIWTGSEDARQSICVVLSTLLSSALQWAEEKKGETKQRAEKFARESNKGAVFRR